MTLSPEKIRRAVINRLRPARTTGAQICDALDHTSISHKKSQGNRPGFNESLSPDNDEMQNNFTAPIGYPYADLAGSG